MDRCASIMWCDGRPDGVRPDVHYTKCNGVAGHAPTTMHTGECPEFGWVRTWNDNDVNTDSGPPVSTKWILWTKLDEKSSFIMIGPFNSQAEAEQARDLARRKRGRVGLDAIYELHPAKIVTTEVTVTELVVE